MIIQGSYIYISLNNYKDNDNKLTGIPNMITLSHK